MPRPRDPAAGAAQIQARERSVILGWATKGRENHPYQATWHEEDAAFSALICASNRSRRTWNGFRNELGVSQGSGKCALQ